MRFVKNSIKLFGACIVSLILLSGFVLFYSFSGTHIVNNTGATDYKWLPAQFKSNMVEGFSWLRMDNEGFNNIDSSNCSFPDVLLMGSSHWEAINVSKKQNTSYYLSELLSEYRVYNIGTSGHYIYQCAKNLRDAVEYYSPQQYVVVETATVSLDNERMERVINGSLPSIPSYDSGVLSLIQKYCPAIKSIYNCTINWRNANKTTSTQPGIMDLELLDSFIHMMSNSVGNDCKLIIIYHPSTVLDNNGNLLLQTSNADLLSFKNTCAKYSIEFVDISKQVIDLYNRQHRLIHGFENTAVGSGHLNRYGHLLLAEQLASIIKEESN